MCDEPELITVADEYDELIEAIVKAEYRVLLVDGPRGVGKSTFCNRISTDQRIKTVFYKTWGHKQRDIRKRMQEDGLDLTQGAFFALDIITQLGNAIDGVVLVDRSNMSAMVYQQDFWIDKTELHRYYVQLIESCKGAMIYLWATEEEITKRRIERGGKDEFSDVISRWPDNMVKSLVHEDVQAYERSLILYEVAGMRYKNEYDLGTTCATVLEPSDNRS